LKVTEGTGEEERLGKEADSISEEEEKGEANALAKTFIGEARVGTFFTGSIIREGNTK
jgi:hypothetical protein